MFSIFSINSEADASELIENIEKNVSLLPEVVIEFRTKNCTEVITIR